MAQTKSKERVRKYGEVFTGQKTVDEMCDMLEAEDMFQPSATYLEPACGEGVFVLEILRRKFARCKSRGDFTVALKSVYAMDILADNVETTIQNVIALCDQYFEPTKAEMKIINDHIIQADSLKIMKMMNECPNCGADMTGGDGNG